MGNKTLLFFTPSMSRIKILQPQEIRRFDEPPQFSDRQRSQFFHLLTGLEQAVPQLRKPITKVGFILQWGYFRASGRFFATDLFRTEDLQYVCDGLEIEWSSLVLDAQSYSSQLAGVHQRHILKLLDWHPFGQGRERLFQQIAHLVEQPLLPRKVLHESRAFLVRHQIEVPDYDVFQRLITTAYRLSDGRRMSRLNQVLTTPHRTLLDELLQNEKPFDELPLLAYKKISQSERPGEIKASLVLFDSLSPYFDTIQPIAQALNLSDSAISYYAYKVRQLRNVQLKSHRERHLYLICLVIHQYRVWQDTFVDILLSSVRAAQNATNKTRQQLYFASNRQRKAATLLALESRADYRMQVEAIRLITRQPVDDADKLRAIEGILAADLTLTADQEELVSQLAGETNRSDDEDFRRLFAGRFLWLNLRVGALLTRLRFNAQTSERPLLDAVLAYRQGRGGLTQPADELSWLAEAERKALYVTDSQGHPVFQKQLYKVLLFEAVAEGLKSGRMNLTHSYRYRSLEEYLIDKSTYLANRNELLRDCGLAPFADIKALLAKLKDELDAQYQQTNTRSISGQNDHLTFNALKKPVIGTPKVHETDTSVISPYFAAVRYISVLDLLADVERSAPYLSQIEHLGGKYAKTRPSAETFFAAIVALGCNIGIDKMANISKGVKRSTLQLAADLYLTADSLKQANDQLVTFKNQLALPELHRQNADGLHTSSDGQKFLVTEESLNADYSYKYPGFDKASTVNTAIDERFALFHSLVISASEREAPYVIDIHLNNPAIRSTIHSTDTGGYSEVIFGVMNLLDILFAPRIKDVGSQQIYTMNTRREYTQRSYPLLPDSRIDTDLIIAQWEDILRLMVTLKSGKTTAYRIFKRLSSYARQNPLHQALKEYGKIIKSGFILRYFDDMALRQAIEKQLSRIELVNRFSKAVFFGNNQEFSVGLKEDQEKIVHARRLIQNAIIVWNYLYMSQLMSQLTKQGEIAALVDAIRQGTAVVWQHVNLQGEYDFNKLLKNKTSRFNLEAIFNLKVPD